MSISIDMFAAEGQFQRFDPYAEPARRVAMFHLQCRSCGYEPEDPVVPPRICPKCHGESFERFKKPGSLLANAERHYHS